jgi:hypothetical protein
MPQFDTAAFFNQLFYLTVIFYVFYILLLHSYLPGLTRILKVRRKKLEIASLQGSSFQGERETTSNGYEAVLTGFSGQSRQTLTSSLQGGEDWSATLVPSKEKTELAGSNGTFLQLIASLRAQRVVISTLLK